MGYNSGLPVSLPEIRAPRTELLRRFDNAAARQIVYIQAPGGYGKTVTMLLWLQQSGRRAAWRCFDEYDNTPVLFYKTFCLALLSVIPQNDVASGIVDLPAFNESPVEFTIELLTRADYGEEKVALIMDDFHKITNDTIKKSLPFVLKRLPESVTVFILSRGEMPDSFNDLRNNNKISLLDTHELAFTGDEIRKHFASYGRFVTEQGVETIRAYSEGWIILLNAMVFSGNLQMDIIKSKLTYKSFFEKNIWNTLDEKKRIFLMKTAVPDEFTVELCEILTEVDNCKDYIDMLIVGNANMSISEGIYRYHDLFRDFLREQLEKSQIDKSGLYKKTAQYYLSKYDYLTARRYSVRSGDHAVIIESIKRVAENKNFSLDEYVEFSRVFNETELPEAVCEKLPFLYIPRVLFYFLVGNIAKFEYFMDKMQASMPVLAEHFPQMMENALTCCTMDYRIKLPDFLEFMRSMPAVTWISDMQQVSTVSFQMPFIHRSVRDFYMLTDSGLTQALVSEVWQNQLKENCECFFLCVHAGLCIEQNKLYEASETLSKAQDALNEKVACEIGYAIFLGQAEADLCKGKRDVYDLYLGEAARYIEENDAHYLKRNFWAYKARLGLMDGDGKTAEQWLENYFINNSGYGALYKIYQNLTTARAYIVLGEYNEASNALHLIEKLADTFDRPLDAAEARVLLSVIDWSAGKKKEARDRLHSLLIALQPCNFIRVIANEGKAVMPILVSVLKKLDKEPKKDVAFYRYVKEAHVAAYEQSKRFNGLTCGAGLTAVKLSKQQALILELLSKGHKNAEIVEITGLSLNTIRTHTKLVYRKLEVTNVMDAIVRAKEIGLLE